METNKKCPFENNGDFHSIEEAQNQMYKMMENEFCEVDSEQNQTK